MLTAPANFDFSDPAVDVFPARMTDEQRAQIRAARCVPSEGETLSNIPHGFTLITITDPADALPGDVLLPDEYNAHTDTVIAPFTTRNERGWLFPLETWNVSHGRLVHRPDTPAIADVAATRRVRQAERDAEWAVFASPADWKVFHDYS